MLYYGRTLHMSTTEIYCTEYGKMIDMINCIAISNGAKPKRKKKWTTMESILWDI